jgi:WD40 repeat protein
MATVFISYSRKDITFAKRLAAELHKCEMDFWIDWEGIPPTVDWWKEIEKGIEEADIFLFLISPDSSVSKVCGQEIDTAVKNAKRIIPIVVRDIKGGEAPKSLSHLNWIFFRESDDFDAAFQKLLTSIHTDYEWVKEHRWLQVRALDWQRENKDKGALLRGKDLLDAETNLATNSSKEPRPTDLQREYVLQSRKATDRQKGILTSLSIAGIIALAGLAMFGFYQAGQATASEAKAVNNASTAEAASTLAVSNEQQARAAQANAERETRRATAGQLALLSKSFLNTYPQRAALLALEAIHISQAAGEPVLPEAEEALRFAREYLPGIGLSGLQHEPSLLQFTNVTNDAAKEKGQWLIAGTVWVQGEARIWNLNELMTNPTYQPSSISFPTDYNSNMYLSPHQTWLVIDTGRETQLWKIAVVDESRSPLVFQGSAKFVDPQTDNLVLESQEAKMILWKIDPDGFDRTKVMALSGSFITASPDQQYFLTKDPDKGFLLWKSPIGDTPITLQVDPNREYEKISTDPNSRWLIFVEKVPHPEIQMPIFDETGEQTGTKPWNSSNLILIPLNAPDKPPYRFEQEVNVRSFWDFSPTGNKVTYPASRPPGTDGTEAPVVGLLDLRSEPPVNRVFTELNSFLEWVNDDWMFDPLHSIFWDFRYDPPTPVTMSDGWFSLEKDDKGYARFDVNGKYLLGQPEPINFEKLDTEHVIVEESPAYLAVTSIAPTLLSPENLTSTMENFPQIAGLEDTVTLTAQSPDGQWFVSGARDGSLRLWNFFRPAELSAIQLWGSPSYIALSNDGRWLAEGRSLWGLEDGKPTAVPYALDDADLSGIGTFSPDSRWFIKVSQAFAHNMGFIGFEAKLVDLRQLNETRTFHMEIIYETKDFFDTIMFSGNSQWVVLSSAKESSVINLSTKKVYPLPYRDMLKFSFTPDQQHIVVIQEQYHPENNSTTYKNPEILSLPSEAIDNLEKIGEIAIDNEPVLSRDGRWLIEVPAQARETELSGESKLWDLNCLIEKYECRPILFLAGLAAFSPDSRILLLGSKKAEDIQEWNYEVWDLQPWAFNKNIPPKKIFVGNTSQVLPTVSRTGHLVVFGKIQYDPIHPAGLSSTWNAHTFRRNQTTFDGAAYLSIGYGGGGGGAVGSFQTDYRVSALLLGDSTPQVLSLRGHESNISHSEVSPNERFVLTYSGGQGDDERPAEKILRLWDIEKLRLDPTRPAVTLPLYLEGEISIDEIAFSPDSEWIYIIDSTDILYYYPTSIETLQRQACFTVGRNFIINEWQRYFPHLTYRKTCENLPQHPSANGN